MTTVAKKTTVDSNKVQETDKKPAAITEVQKQAAEDQIVAHHKTIDYDTREYPVEVLVQKYLKKLEEDENELFVPDYQREHTWPEDHQSKFIESVLIGLPIQYLFVADVPSKEGRLEIVDGSQRIRTLARLPQSRPEFPVAPSPANGHA